MGARQGFERRSTNLALIDNGPVGHAHGPGSDSSRSPRSDSNRVGPASFSATDFQLKEIERRRLLIRTFDALIAKGLSQTAASKELQVSVQSVWRWRKRIAPATHRCGRKSKASRFEISTQILRRIEALQLAGMSNAMAWRSACDHPECNPELAAFVKSAKTLPPSFLTLTKLDRRKATIVEARHLGRTLATIE